MSAVEKVPEGFFRYHGPLPFARTLRTVTRELLDAKAHARVMWSIADSMTEADADRITFQADSAVMALENEFRAVFEHETGVEWGAVA